MSLSGPQFNKQDPTTAFQSQKAKPTTFGSWLVQQAKSDKPRTVLPYTEVLEFCYMNYLGMPKPNDEGSLCRDIKQMVDIIGKPVYGEEKLELIRSASFFQRLEHIPTATQFLELLIIALSPKGAQMNTENQQASDTQNKVEITVNERKFSLPLVHGTMDEWGIDISKLRGSTNVITYDPGYGNTGSCNSGITFIDGEKGILLYRGYPIEELAKHYSFTDSAYLLAYGELPSSEQLKAFRSKVLSHTVLPECIGELIKTLPKDAHPMAILSMCMTRLLIEYPQYSKNDRAADVKAFDEAYPMLMGAMPSIAAMIHRHRKGLPFVKPDTSMTFAKNFLNMMFTGSDHEKSVNDSAAHALMVMLTLHADHEQNCSTSTMRLVSSSGTGYNSLSAAILALWGPSHGGANMEVIKMLQQIHTSGKTVEQFVQAAKDKKSGVKLMGFGHRVYKNFDPRAKFIKQACDDLLHELGVDHDPLLGIAMELEKVALEDQYFKDRNLYPNVDFYSGIIFKAMGLDPDMFTVMFAIGRTPGWLSHWYEQAQDPNLRIGRPRQIYTGEPTREVPAPSKQK